MDVAIVGAGPAGLACAIELARLARGSDGRRLEIEIGVFEKASAAGDHSLSGAVVDPGPLRTLFPDVPEADFPFRGEVGEERVYLLTSRRAVPLPVPPTMRNHGNRIVSICELVRWMGAKAEELGVHLFPGFPVEALLVDEDAVQGVMTTPSGLDRNGMPGPSHVPPMDVSARVTVLAEGARGHLTQGWEQWAGARSAPQTYALGVKELWQVKEPLDRVIHTLGWPIPWDTFGGSWMYPMGDGLLSLGLVVGLDSPHGMLDVHGLLQRFKTHPFVRSILTGGELVEWGAKTIPEGGYHSVTERRHGAGLCVIGDAAGYVDVPSLKGIHYAVQSGLLAARAIFRALESGDTSAAALGQCTEAIDRSFIMTDLWKTRNIRSSFRAGLIVGVARAGFLTLTGGRFPRGKLDMGDDADVTRTMHRLPSPPAADGSLIFTKQEAVYRSGNRTRDDIPVHLITAEEVPEEVAQAYSDLCPAGVYESRGGRLVINAPNCIDCKATDVLGPRWTPREGGSGPAYRRM